MILRISRDPDNVLMCVLCEDGDNDISVQIQHTLFEAYCWENEIIVKKVGPDDKLGVILVNQESNLNKNLEDHSCALIMLPTREKHMSEFTEQDPWFSSDILLPG